MEETNSRRAPVSPGSRTGIKGTKAQPQTSRRLARRKTPVDKASVQEAKAVRSKKEADSEGGADWIYRLLAAVSQAHSLCCTSLCRRLILHRCRNVESRCSPRRRSVGRPGR